MSIKADVFRHVEKHPYEKLYLKDIIESLGVDEERATTVRNVFSVAVRKNELPGLEIVQRGAAWIYHPAAPTEPTDVSRVDVVGKTKKGSMILEDNDGNIWIARPVEE